MSPLPCDLLPCRLNFGSTWTAALLPCTWLCCPWWRPETPTKGGLPAGCGWLETPSFAHAHHAALRPPLRSCFLLSGLLAFSQVVGAPLLLTGDAGCLPA